MTDSAERFRRGAYPTDPDPTPIQRRFIDDVPEGRALDLATGTGRNALFLAGEGYTVDTVDKSRVALETARGTARHRGVADRINWMQAASRRPSSASTATTLSPSVITGPSTAFPIARRRSSATNSWLSNTTCVPPDRRPPGRTPSRPARSSIPEFRPSRASGQRQSIRQ